MRFYLGLLAGVVAISMGGQPAMAQTPARTAQSESSAIEAEPMNPQPEAEPRAGAPAAAPAAAEAPEPSPDLVGPAPAVGPPAAPAAPAAGGVESATVHAADEIVVTGTHFNRADLNTAAPVTVIDRASISQSGRVSIGDVLQGIPAQSNGQNAQVNNGGDGSSNVDLRGLGAKRTLVLLNGRRFVGGGSGVNGVVDLNTIPFAAIERIEVLRDGASAIYGSDAIGGVVNIITRKRFQGSEAAVYGGASSYGDGQVLDASVVAGGKSDKFSYLFSAGYYRQWPVSADQRGFSARPLQYDFAAGKPRAVGSPVIPKTVIWDDGISGGNASWQKLVADNAGDPNAGTYVRGADGTWRTAELTAPEGEGGDAFNSQPYNYLTVPWRRFTAFATSSLELSTNTKLFAELVYANRGSEKSGAPEPLTTADAGQAGVRVSAENVYNPFGRDFLDMGRRLVEFGPRRSEYDLSTLRFVGGFSGLLSNAFGPLQGWSWEASLNYGRTLGIQTFDGNLQVSRLRSAVGPSFYDGDGIPRCGTPGNVIEGCVPLNLFGGVGSIDREQIAYLTFTGVERILTEQTMVAVNTSGDLFRLAWSRPASLAAGWELRHERGGFTPDPLVAAGDSTGNQIAPVSGAYTANEGYLELLVPIAGGYAGLDDLEVSGAARLFSYNNFGSDFTYKVAAKYRPIRDLTFRGTYSTAFRAPNVSELFSGQSDSFPNASAGDPCSLKMNPNPSEITRQRCEAAGGFNEDTAKQFKARVGGSPDLEPERAESFTAGFVLEPRFAKGLSLTADWYSIDVRNSVEAIGSDIILDSCYRNARALYCDLVRRDPATHKIAAIDDTLRNVGGLRTAGLDISARYDLRSSAGEFAVGADLMWLQKMDYELADGKIVHAKGNYDVQIVYPAVKAMGRLTWALKGLSAGINGRFVGAYKVCSNNVCNVPEGEPAAPAFGVPAYAVWDLFAGYRFATSGGTTSLTFGVNNVLAQEPPLLYSAALANNTDSVAGYDHMGRFFYLKLVHSL